MRTEQIAMRSQDGMKAETRHSYAELEDEVRAWRVRSPQLIFDGLSEIVDAGGR